jgi:hypothetical protein
MLYKCRYCCINACNDGDAGRTPGNAYGATANGASNDTEQRYNDHRYIEKQFRGT